MNKANKEELPFEIGIVQWCVDAIGVEAVFRTADLGLTCLHIDAGGDDGSPYIDNKAVREQYLEASRISGVELSGIGVNLLNQISMTSTPETEDFFEARRLIKLALFGAQQLGVNLVFLPSFERGEINTTLDFERTINMLRWACQEADETGIQIATENLLGESGNRTILESVGEYNFSIMIDTYNPVVARNNVSRLISGLWGNICAQVHAKDGVDGNMGSAPLNKGDADFAQSLLTLKALGFSGKLLLENDFSICIEEKIQEDITTIIEIWNT